MSFLDDMEKKKKTLTRPKHPLCNEELRLREAYATGVALLMARADENLNSAEKEYLQELADALLLTDDPTERIIATVTDADADIVESIITSFQKQEHKYLFILELYRAAYVDGNLQPEEQKMMDLFSEWLGLKAIENDFLKQFADGMEQQSRESMQKALLEAYNFWIELPMHIFKFFCNSLEIIPESTKRDYVKLDVAVRQGVDGAQRLATIEQERITEERKKAADNLIYTDPQTCLMWVRNGNLAGKEMKWDEAMEWVKKLDYGGYSDWRLPTEKELLYFSAFINPCGFNNVKDRHYWSSSSAERYEHFSVSIDDRTQPDVASSSDSYVSSCSVWPLRGGIFEETAL
ncbi:MAG: DUF1566 domain-containing protein [Desulfuromonadales bacterium]